MLLVAMLSLAACHRDKDSGADACVAPLGVGTPVAGDVNGDGEVDVADATRLFGGLFRAGAAPACDAAADLVQDGLVEAGDGFALLSYLYAGRTALPTLAEGACATPAIDEGTCAPLSWTIDAPNSSSGTSFEATIGLSTPELSPEAWSLSVSASGCSVTAASAAQAVALGYDRTGLSSAGGAVSAVILDWHDGSTLAARAADWPLLTLSISGSCGTCTLSVEDGQQGDGQPVADVVSVGGRSYRPEAAHATITLCGASS